MTAQNQFRLSNLPKPQLVVTLLIILLLIITALIFAGLKASQLFRQQYTSRQNQQMQAPPKIAREDVKRVLLKKTLEDGSIRYYEVSANGVINVYDEDMNLLRTEYTSNYRIRNLFDKINANLSLLQSDASGTTILTIYTNTGQYTIIIDDDLNQEIDDILDEIVDEIEDIIDDALAPTPTLQPTATPIPGQPTSTPYPTSTPFPGLPTPTPDPNATPTPLPDYMTAPPFKCSDYDYVGRPINISNVICGAE